MVSPVDKSDAALGRVMATNATDKMKRFIFTALVVPLELLKTEKLEQVSDCETVTRSYTKLQSVCGVLK